MKIELQEFGGDWTENKLNCLRKYLSAYTTILKEYSFNYAYIDAFAGTGYRYINYQKNTVRQLSLLPEMEEKASESLVAGSARIALQVDPKFNKYIFVEKDIEKVEELLKLKDEFPELANRIDIINSDANIYFQNVCQMNWKKHRAVAFLDPFGMQIPWSTIKLIAQTEAIDLWYLFPVGIAINRLLKRDGQIRQSIRSRLDNTFGCSDWYELFYEKDIAVDIFGHQSLIRKTVNCQLIGEYFVNRLKEIFPGVAENPLMLVNSQNSPLYLLCFAAANKKGATTAIKIAQHILKH